ncbi:MAG: hypothetical protein Q4D14_00005 [Bacteroidales bacterium]|nr:hypothetical protein [Bacteroidales bacterium]
MRHLKFVILALMLCGAAMVSAQYTVPGLTDIEYNAVYNQNVAVAPTVANNGGIVAPFTAGDGIMLAEGEAVDASIPSTPGDGTGVIPTPLGNGFWILLGAVLLALTLRVRVVLRRE